MSMRKNRLLCYCYLLKYIGLNSNASSTYCCVNVRKYTWMPIHVVSNDTYSCFARFNTIEEPRKLMILCLLADDSSWHTKAES
jgi:hypothetical protein